ncbi:MAG: DUF5131 family protein [Nevskiales bacterium]|nr:DUF5131 family protein [Nevskiales bacterium]
MSARSGDFESEYRVFFPEESSQEERLDVSEPLRLFGDEILWNVVAGCSLAAPVCRECSAREYWETWARSSGNYYHDSSWNRVLSYEYALTVEPGKWPKDRRHNILVAPASDLFHERVSDHFLDRVSSIMQQHPQHTFYVVTKRVARMKSYLNGRAAGRLAEESRSDRTLRQLTWPLPNVRIGISCEDQPSYLARIVPLIETKAESRFVIIEPMLKPVRLDQVPLPGGDILWPLTGVVQGYRGLNAEGKPEWDPVEHPRLTIEPIDWVVVGGFRGSVPRPMHPIWVRMVQVACERAKVPFFFKGWGDYAPAKKPDLDGDASLVIVSADGSMRGRGVGSATNYLARDSGGRVPDVYMSRQIDPVERTMLAGKLLRNKPRPLKARRVRLIDRSDLARMLHRLGDQAPATGPVTARVEQQAGQAPGATQDDSRSLGDKMSETAAWVRDKLNTPLW